MGRKSIMKRIGITLIGGLLCLMTSCNAVSTLDKSIWYNTSLVENDGTKAMMVTSLYFLSADTVDIYNSVRNDSSMIVKPFKYASGTYSVQGKSKKETEIKIETKTIDGRNILYEGAYHKSDAMYLTSPDSVIKVFGKLKNITLQ